MKPEKEMNEEVRQLLDSLEEHGKNARRQQQLSELIDGLSGERKTENGERRTFRFPLSVFRFWWAIGAAAAVLLLWLMIKSATKKTPNMNEEILVEGTIPMDSLKTEVKNEVKEVNLEQPIIEEVLLAEETPSKPAKPEPIAPQKPDTKTEKPNEIIVEKPEEIVGEEKLLAEATPSESAEKTDTSTVESNNIPASIEENLSPLTSHLAPQSSPQRRVIRSLNLVCYECQKEPEIETSQFSILNSQFPTTLFGQAKDPNMKNGAMTFELKLN